MLNEDFKDILLSLLEEKVEFLLIGAYALAAYGYPRATKDIDIWLHAGEQNAPRILSALRRFGAPLEQTTAGDFLQEGTVLQIGVAPKRIDLTTKIDGVRFEDAYLRKTMVDIEGMRVPLISKEDLVANKLASGRPQDLVDVEFLRKSGN